MYLVFLFSDSSAFLILFLRQGFMFSRWPCMHSVAKDVLELLILCLHLLIAEIYRHSPLCPVYSVLRTRTRALCMVGKHSAN